MRIGILSSSEGSVFGECVKIAGGRHSFVVATDRACGIERLAERHGIPVRRLQGDTNDDLSRAAVEWFDQSGGVDVVLLFYVRIVGPSLFGKIPTFNLHPSLLPAYPGFNAIRRAIEDGSRFLGATLHLVSTAVDGGPILAQACAPLARDKGLDYANKLSFLQKTYLSLVLFEQMQQRSFQLDLASGQLIWSGGAAPSTAYFNPALSDPGYLAGIGDLLAREGFAHLLHG